MKGFISVHGECSHPLCFVAFLSVPLPESQEDAVPADLSRPQVRREAVQARRESDILQQREFPKNITPTPRAAGGTTVPKIMSPAVWLVDGRRTGCSYHPLHSPRPRLSNWAPDPFRPAIDGLEGGRASRSPGRVRRHIPT